MNPTIPPFHRTPTDKPQTLVAKYRPRCLAEVIGQPAITASLTAFAANPAAGAMLFSGDSGCGKTSTAHALAAELGCAVEEKECGGVFEIASGDMTADQVRDRLEALLYRPLCGSGWRVLICNEADRMARPAETLWLDGLEHLPGRCLVIFTTNEPARLSQRFRDRCECYHFEGGSDRLRPWIQALARQVWANEVGGEMPDLPDLGMPTLGGNETMYASLRLALQQLQRVIRDHRANIPQADALPVKRPTPPKPRRQLDIEHAKKQLDPAEETLRAIGQRWEGGELINKLAAESGMSWQRLLKALRGLGFEAHTTDASGRTWHKAHAPAGV